MRALALAIGLSVTACQQPKHVVAEGSAAMEPDRDVSLPKPDPWEADNSLNRWTPDCVEIDRALIAPVPAQKRDEAIARLKTVALFALGQSEVAAILDLKGDNVAATAAGRIAAAISGLTERRRRQLVDHVGGWSLADQERLDKLQVLVARPDTSRLTPFLVRAVAKNEFGAFSASSCGDVLFVHHGSMGYRIPPSIRLPVVIFLDHAPATVRVIWGMAR